MTVKQQPDSTTTSSSIHASSNAKNNATTTEVAVAEPPPSPTPQQQDDEPPNYDSEPTFESWPLITEPEPRPETESDGSEISKCKKIWHFILDFYHKYDFPIHVMIVILIAYLYPPLGAVYVAPFVTAEWIAVIYIFFMFGLGVKTADFAKAMAKMRFNILIQLYNFGFISAVVFGVTRFLSWAHILDQNLADGMAICACLPMSINVGIVLTSAAGGDEAIAVFHTTFGNFVGVFLSPALILGYLGTTGFIDIGQIYFHLTMLVIVPLIFGQCIQRLVHPIADFYQEHKRFFKKSAECALVFIIFTIFSKKFYSGTKGNIGQVFVMMFCQLILLTSFMGTMWLLLKFLYPNQPKLRVTGTFIAVQKTISLGVPLISAVYSGNPDLSYYTLPIMVWHPMQLTVGSIIVPRMIKFLEREKERLAHKGGSDAGDDSSNEGDVSKNANDDVEAVAARKQQDETENDGDVSSYTSSNKSVGNKKDVESSNTSYRSSKASGHRIM